MIWAIHMFDLAMGPALALLLALAMCVPGGQRPSEPGPIASSDQPPF